MKDVLFSLAVGALLFWAGALLRERAHQSELEGPASTVYGEF
jgi:hypothetical protein